MGRPTRSPAFAVLTLLIVAGCAGRRAPEPAPVAAAPPIHCPDGASVRRGPAPAGWWCVAYDAIGRSMTHGTRWEVHEDGAPAQRLAALSGERHGAQWSWREDGTLYARGAWIHGLRQGWWMELSPDRRIRSEGPMVDGRREGLWVKTDLESGTVVVGPYVQGRRNGTFHDLVDGRVVRERLFRDDRLLHVRAH